MPPDEDHSNVALGASPEEDGIAETGSDRSTGGVSSPWD
jgi:hypothetical protein